MSNLVTFNMALSKGRIVS